MQTEGRYAPGFGACALFLIAVLMEFLHKCREHLRKKVYHGIM